VRQTYEQHVEDHFARRENSYKKLKLLHTERRMVDLSDGDLKVLELLAQKLERDAQHDYLSYLQNQVEENKKHRLMERNNQSLELGRYGAVAPECGQSPAYLGLLPFETDRKRQLELIDRKFGFAVPKYLEALAKNIREHEPRGSAKYEQNP